MDFTKYKNNKKYGEYQTKEREEYCAEQARLKQLFYDDCALLHNYVSNPKRSLLESLAYGHGHSSGYSDIYNWIIELLPLIE